MKSGHNPIRAGLLWVVWLLPALANAQFTFTTNNGSITITGYSGPGGAVSVPDTINGLAVTGISAGAFEYKSNLTSVIIPEGVTSIQNSTFLFCYNLTSVTFPDSVTNIGMGAFFGCGITNLVLGNNVLGIGVQAFCSCQNLTSVSMGPNVINIARDAFYDCENLTNVMLGANVTSLGLLAFGSCYSLTGIAIPDKVSSIGNNAFDSCFSLQSVTFPDSVVSLGSGAFTDCWSLTNVMFGSGVASIGAEPFYDCSNLVSIEVSASNPAFSSVGGVLFDKRQTAIIQYPLALKGSYTIPWDVTNIESEAFEQSSLTSVTVPWTVNTIEDYAFDTCATLPSVFFEGDAPANIGTGAFPGDDTTVYYLADTYGWSSTLAGMPTALWLPQLTPDAMNSGGGTNDFGFTINWASYQWFAVDVCTNLDNPVWQPMQTNCLASNSFYFTDPQWTSNPAGFYRVRSVDFFW